MRDLVQTYRPLVGLVVLCQVLGLSRATYYRKQPPAEPPAALQYSAPQSELAPLAQPADGESTEERGQGGQVATAPPPQWVEGAGVAAARAG